MSLKPPCPICRASSKFQIQKDGCDFFQCSECTFLFHRVGIGSTGLSQHISDHYNRNYWKAEEEEARRREEEDALNRAFELIFVSSIPVKRILDFGCGLGVTVEKLRKVLGMDAIGVDIYGQFEETPYLHRRSLEQVVAQYGPEAFDAIFSIEVFEHLEDPVSVMKQLDSILKPGGKILVNTLTIEAMEQSDPEKTYIDPLIRGHISIWSIKTFQKMAEMFGYSASFMGARKYAVLLTKAPQEDSTPSRSNMEVFRRLGSWCPQHMQEYMRLVYVERDFENHGKYIRTLLKQLKGIGE